MAGAPGLEPGPSVLETDMLAINTMPPKKYQQSFISLPGVKRVFDRNGKTFLAPTCQDRFSYSSWLNSYVAYSLYKPGI